MEDDVKRIADVYHAWRGEANAGEYLDVSGFCKATSMVAIREYGYILTPGRYVGTKDVESDGIAFEERFAQLTGELEEHFIEADRLAGVIRKVIGAIKI